MSSGSPRGFYHLDAVEIADQSCEGTACFVAGHLRPNQWRQALASEPRIYCLGRCYDAPACAADDSRPRVVVDAPVPVTLARVATGGAANLGAYLAAGGYQALEQALALRPERVMDAIRTSGLRGRGGAAFPAGSKWQTVQRAAGDTRSAVVVANADEGDPGAYIDRFILEDDPHVVVEAMAIAAHAVGASAGYVYVRKEYPAAHSSITRAVAQARGAGVLGDRLLGGGPPFDITVVRGQGSYVCGEETALLNALEGVRPGVRPRPPFPAQHGLGGAPTLVHNIETLAAVPWIVLNGGPAYASMGTVASPGTKVVSLNSLFRRPGLYEVEFGTPVAEIVDRLGGGLVGGELRGVLVGGPLAGVLPPHLLDTPLCIDAMRRVGCDVGHGGIVAFDDHTSIFDLVHQVFRFGAYESCGVCTPCRAGSARIDRMLAALSAGANVPGAADLWRETVSALGATSLCGHGTGLAAFAASIDRYYAAQVATWFA